LCWQALCRQRKREEGNEVQLLKKKHPDVRSCSWTYVHPSLALQLHDNLYHPIPNSDLL
jgi:hypothetical protein